MLGMGHGGLSALMLLQVGPAVPAPAHPHPACSFSVNQRSKIVPSAGAALRCPGRGPRHPRGGGGLRAPAQSRFRVRRGAARRGDAASRGGDGPAGRAADATARQRPAAAPRALRATRYLARRLPQGEFSLPALDVVGVAVLPSTVVSTPVPPCFPRLLSASVLTLSLQTSTASTVSVRRLETLGLRPLQAALALGMVAAGATVYILVPLSFILQVRPPRLNCSWVSVRGR